MSPLLPSVEVIWLEGKVHKSKATVYLQDIWPDERSPSPWDDHFAEVHSLHVLQNVKIAGVLCERPTKVFFHNDVVFGISHGLGFQESPFVLVLRNGAVDLVQITVIIIHRLLFVVSDYISMATVPAQSPFTSG